MKSKEDLN